MKTLKQIWDERGDKTRIKVMQKNWPEGDFITLVFISEEAGQAACLNEADNNSNLILDIYDATSTGWESLEIKWFERTDIDELVREEGKKIYEKYGIQDLPDFVEKEEFKESEIRLALEDFRENVKTNCWSSILFEEVLEALVETDPEKKKAELIQIIAVAKQFWDAIDRRCGK